MVKVAVVLSGCGVMDGSEIHEAVACLYALEEQGVSYQCVAPDIEQRRVVNHVTNETMEETRNVLIESARIARGKIKALSEVSEKDFDAAIYPGGFGAALNLSDFAINGSSHHVDQQVLTFADSMAKANKPQGFACIAPVIIPKIYGPNVKLTIGADIETIAVLTEMQGKHQLAKADEVVVDIDHKVASTPAYMSAKNIREVFSSFKHLAEKVISMIN